MIDKMTDGRDFLLLSERRCESCTMSEGRAGMVLNVA